MKKFQFHLQKVLELKVKEKEQAEWAFGKSVQKKEEEETKLYQLTEHHDEMTQMLHTAVQGEFCSAADLIDITRYRQTVQRSIATQQRTLYGCEQDMEKCKSMLTERMQETKVWQRLREKAHEQHAEVEKHREQKELDEIGIQIYLRRSQ